MISSFELIHLSLWCDGSRAQLDRGVIIDNLELVMLTIDEVVENGQIVELDPSAVANRVLMRGVDGGPVRPL